MAVNCTEIVNLLTKGGINPGSPYIEGYLVIDALPNPNVAGLPQLDVDAVYTTAQPPGAAPSPVNGISVNHVNGRVLPAGKWPF
jgi:hypothetical protein